MLRQHAGEDLWLKVFFVAQSVSARRGARGVYYSARRRGGARLCPRRALVIPKLAEGFLQQVRCVEAPVYRKQQLRVLVGAAGESLRMGEQGVFLALDDGRRVAMEPAVFAVAYGHERLA